MRVRIDREREERKIATGWFARTRIPAYCLSLTVSFTEEERYLIRHTGIGRYVFFQAPIPPDVTDPETIKKLKAEDFGLFFVSRLARIRRRRPCSPSGPTSSPPTKARRPFGSNLKSSPNNWRAPRGTTESSVVYEL